MKKYQLLLHLLIYPFYDNKKTWYKRIFSLNKQKIDKNQDYIIYLCSRDFRLNFNFAIYFGIFLAKKLNKKFFVCFLTPSFSVKTKKDFFQAQFNIVKQNFSKNNIKFTTITHSLQLNNFLNSKKIVCILKDFNPIENLKISKKYKIFEIDSHNILPARYIASKQMYNALSFRKNVYMQLYKFLNPTLINTFKETNHAQQILNNFIQEKLPFYEKYKNDPTLQYTSNLSPFLNFGFISSHQVAIKVIEAKNIQNINKEAFLEQLIVRKELSDNFCLYCKNFKNFDSVPYWAKMTLKKHTKDTRNYTFTFQNLKNAKTYDDLWNAIQIQLVKEGKIQSYLRMYWAKQLLYWTKSPQEALGYAIRLNDKFALDSPSPNGYVSILWAIAGLHDRAFKENPIIGKIRAISKTGIYKKFKIEKYINLYKKL